ncbi:MAG: aspartyl-phosphate phosphatase Spo0E family protein [Clostridia bacterium]|nr:aspartyl-phosphate phosphatase Spo0E family protein [Clostridia bacterium]
MLNDEICILRDKLNDSIASGDDYSVTYKISVELDELIAQFYRNNLKEKVSCK